MHWDSIQGQWTELKSKVREKWGRLTDDEIAGTGGDRQQLEGIIQHAYAKDRDTVRREIDDWATTCECPTDSENAMELGEESSRTRPKERDASDRDDGRN